MQICNPQQILPIHSRSAADLRAARNGTEQGSSLSALIRVKLTFMPTVNPSWKREVTHVTLPAGEHKIDLYNYGYKPESRNVTIEAHKTTVIDVTMQAIPGTVSGPWGCITLEGATAAAVLLNGKDPADFLLGTATNSTTNGVGSRN